MFGFVTVAPTLLNGEQQQRYRAWYCGLCQAMGRRCGQSCRLLLAYDMVLPAMLLSSVCQWPEERTSRRCPVHLLKPHAQIHTAATDYAADMNVLLAYHKLRDDWQDDRNPAALAAAACYRGAFRRLSEQYPRQSAAMKECLQALSRCEQDGETCPDLPADCFGTLMGEVFVADGCGDELSQDLRAFGMALGRFIYLMDAATDLRRDLKHERYNPLTGFPSDAFRELLQMLGGEVMQAFDRLPVTADRDIMENILCAGVWTRYEATQQRYQKKGHGKQYGKESV